jgi:transposase-like protein
VALGVNFEGKKEVLGLWIAEQEGAKFWAPVLNEIRNRGTEDIHIACMDGLSGFPTKFVSYKDLKAVCAVLKAIYRAPSEEAGRAALEQFGEKRQAAYPLIYKS